MRLNHTHHFCRAFGFLGSALFTLFTGTANAAVPVTDSFQLWGSDQVVSARFVGFDINPATAGIETLLPGDTVFINPQSGSDANAQFRFQLYVQSPDGISKLGQLVPRITLVTNAFPDPGVAPNRQDLTDNNPDNWVYGVCYEGDLIYCPSVDESATESRENLAEALSVPLSFGLAETSGGEVLIIGAAIGGAWGRIDDGAEGRFGKYAMYAYNPSTLTRTCERDFPYIDNQGLLLDFALAGVGDYLSANGRAGLDEVRVVWESEDQSTRRISFYDPSDCAKISTARVKGPSL